MSIVVATVAIAPVLVYRSERASPARAKTECVSARVAIVFVSFREANLLVVIYSRSPGTDVIVCDREGSWS